MAIEPDDRVDQLNYLATIQHDIELARHGASEMYSAIERKRQGVKFYDALQDRAALKVVRTAIDALQARLDTHIAADGLVVNQNVRDLNNAVDNLGTVISGYLDEYLVPKPDIGAVVNDEIKEQKR